MIIVTVTNVTPTVINNCDCDDSSKFPNAKSKTHRAPWSDIHEISISCHRSYQQRRQVDLQHLSKRSSNLRTHETCISQPASDLYFLRNRTVILSISSVAIRGCNSAVAKRLRRTEEGNRKDKYHEEGLKFKISQDISPENRKKEM